jgi:hypothetical protein
MFLRPAGASIRYAALYLVLTSDRTMIVGCCMMYTVMREAHISTYLRSTYWLTMLCPEGMNAMALKAARYVRVPELSRAR